MSDRVMCWFCQDRPAVGLTLVVGGEEHGEAMPCCSSKICGQNIGTGYTKLAPKDRKDLFGPFAPTSTRTG